MTGVQTCALPICLARNTLEKAIYNQSRRLVAEPDAPLDLIQAGDLELDE